MPRTGGIYSEPSGTKGVTLQTIQSGKYNAWIDDIKNVLNSPAPLLAGGTGASTADGAAEALGLVSAKDLAGVNTVGGTANAITIVTSRDYDAYENTLYLTFKAASDIAAGGTTIDLDGNGAKSLYKTVAAGLVDVNLGDIIAGSYYTLTYDTAADGGDGAFILLNPGGASSAFQVGDMFRSARTLTTDWLKCNGAVYNAVDYPELALLLPALPDTLSWTSNSSGQSQQLFDFEQSSSLYVGVGNAGTILSSTDRASWASLSSGTSANLQFIAKSSGVWLAAGTLTPTGGGVVTRSTDGATWSTTNLSPSYVFTEIRGLVYSGSAFIVSGYDSSGATVHKVLYGTDGVSWTSVTVAASGPMATNGSRVVMVSTLVASGMVLTSDNHGATWTTRVASGFGQVNDVCWDPVNNLFIAVGETGMIKTSPDGIVWTTRTSGVSYRLASVKAGPYGAMAVGSGQNTVLFSTNGTTWTAKASPTSGGYALLADTVASYHFLYGGSTMINDGVRTLPTQFQVPSDDPTYGWIKAVS